MSFKVFQLSPYLKKIPQFVNETHSAVKYV